MESDSKVLLKKINSLTDYSKGFIEKKALWNKKELFLLKKEYPLLPYQIKSHELIKIDTSLSNKIISEMHVDESLRIFLSVDFQFFLSLFDSFNKFLNYFRGNLHMVSGLNQENLITLFNQIKETCFEEYDEDDKKGLKIIHFFGLINPFYVTNNLELDEPKILFSKILELYYFRNIWKLKGSRPDLREDILVPLNKIFEFLGEESLINKDNINFFFLDEDSIHKESIQNFFCYLQYHCFFEDYVNNLFEEFGDVIKNPLIIFNPSERERGEERILEGYFELDGSICLSKNKELCIIECKNGDRIHPHHITHFVGKANIIEKIYGINIKKYLFSTGSRFKLWENLEDFNSCSDIKIYCRRSFLINFSDLEV